MYLVEMDNRLLLDLHHPVMVEELRNELKKQQRHQQVTLDELLPDFEHLWLRDAQDAGYFSEIVVPLLRVDTGAGGKSAEHSERSLVERERVLLAAERRRFPGEDWSYVKVYAAQSQQEALIAGPLREVVRLLQERPLIDRWFFIRYADPEPHLRLRFHAAEGVDSQQIWALLFPWSVQLARRGLVQRSTLETYDREVERYGGPAAIDLLEHVFTIDSSVVSALIAARYGRQLTLPPIAVATWTLDQLFASWGWNLEQRLAWTRGVAEKYASSAEFRKVRPLLYDLFAPHGPGEAALAEPRLLLEQLVSQQAPCLAPLGAQVRRLAEAGALWASENSLLSSLAHMHCNRLQGLDRSLEQQAYAFWRHTLQSLARRPARAFPEAERTEKPGQGNAWRGVQEP